MLAGLKGKNPRARCWSVADARLEVRAVDAEWITFFACPRKILLSLALWVPGWDRKHVTTSPTRLRC